MENNKDDFQIFKAKGSIVRGFSYAVYTQGVNNLQLDIGIPKVAMDKMNWTTEDHIEFLYSIGKKQIMLRKGDDGFALRYCGKNGKVSIRRAMNGGFHHEPFPYVKQKIKELTDIVYVKDDSDNYTHILIGIDNENILRGSRGCSHSLVLQSAGSYYKCTICNHVQSYE